MDSNQLASGPTLFSKDLRVNEYGFSPVKDLSQVLYIKSSIN